MFGIPRPTVRQLRSVQILLACVYFMFQVNVIFVIAGLEFGILMGYTGMDEPLEETKFNSSPKPLLIAAGIVLAVVAYYVFVLKFRM